MRKKLRGDIEKAQSDADDKLLAGVVSDYVGRNTMLVINNNAGFHERERVLKENIDTSDYNDPVAMTVSLSLKKYCSFRRIRFTHRGSFRGTY